MAAALSPRGALLLASAAAAAAQSTMPVIGILSLPMDLPAPVANFSSYFVASYVKWLEAGGARVVPLLFDAPASATQALLAQLNGVLITGGAAAFFEADGVTLTRYAATAQLALNESLRAAANGEWFPVWGTCLGHELLLVLAAGPDGSVLGDGFDSEDIQLALAPTADAASSRLWGTVNEEQADAWAWLTTENITENLHVKGIEPASFAASAALVAGYRVLSTNVDRNGRPFVSSFEAKTAPVYGTQFHPEKPAYEWTASYNIPHSYHAVVANMALSRFLVNEARKNARAFASRDGLLAALIGNYVPVFTASQPNPRLSVYEELFVFGPWTGGASGGSAAAGGNESAVVFAAVGGSVAFAAAVLAAFVVWRSRRAGTRAGATEYEPLAV